MDNNIFGNENAWGFADPKEIECFVDRLKIRGINSFVLIEDADSCGWIAKGISGHAIVSCLVSFFERAPELWNTLVKSMETNKKE